MHRTFKLACVCVCVCVCVLLYLHRALFLSVKMSKLLAIKTLK